MNFGSKFAFHDSDDEEEQVREDAPAAGPLSSMSAAPVTAPPVAPLQRAFQQQQQQRQPGASRHFSQSLFLGSQRDGGLPPPVDLPAPGPRTGLFGTLPSQNQARAGVPPPFGEAGGAAAASGAAGMALPRETLSDLMKRQPKLKSRKAQACGRTGMGAAAPADAEDGDRGSMKPEAATPRRQAPPSASRARTWTRKVGTVSRDLVATFNRCTCRGCVFLF